MAILTLYIYYMFLGLDNLLPRPGPAGAQNKDISTLDEDIEKEIVDEIRSKEVQEERHERRR